MKKRLIAIALPLFYRFVLYPAAHAARRDGTPIDTQAEPEQEDISNPAPFHLAKGGFDWTVTPRAHYRIRGIVLSRERYYFDWNAGLSPCDVALAWGELSKGGLHKRLSWSQSGRWYYWKYGEDFPHDNAFVSRYSSNNHIVPFDENLKRAARSLRKGEIVELEGDLIDLDGRKGEESRWWHSSLSREDSGDGSCELLLLKRLKVGNWIYE